MAALPENSTDRYFFHYSSAFGSHVAVVRTAPGATISAVVDDMEALCTAIGAGLAENIGQNLDFQAAGSAISVPVAGSSWGGFTFGANPSNAYTDAVKIQAVGRTVTGRRARLGLFGWKLSQSEYRLTGTEEGGISTAAIAIMNTSTAAFYAIDGNKPEWYNYLDIKSNDYWVRKNRP